MINNRAARRSVWKTQFTRPPRILATIFVAAAAACACLVATFASNSVASAGTLTIGVGGSGPVSLDPGTGGEAQAGAWWMAPAYMPLIQQTATGSYTGNDSIASSWKYVDDGLGFQMSIRKGLRCSDGTTLTPADVVASLTYVRGAGGPQTTEFKDFKTISAAGDDVVIKLSQPQSAMPALLSQTWPGGFVICPAGLAAPTKLATQTFGTGPYMIDAAATITGSTYTYVPNPYYYNRAAQYWKTIVVKVFLDSNTGLAALKTGQIQLWLANGVSDWTAVKAVPGLHLILDPPGGW